MRNRILSLLAALFFMGSPLVLALDTGDSLWAPYGSDQYNLNSGNVGIGSTGNVPSKLYVVGDIKATRQFLGDGSALTGITTFSSAGSGSEIQARSTASTVQAVTGSATSGGNIGIGTTLVGNKLNVGGAAAIGATYAGVTAPSNGLLVQGNVGVGTINPGVALDITGAARASSPYLSSLGTVSLPGYSFTGDPDTGVFSNTANNVDISTGGAIALSAIGQNVGIGTYTTTDQTAQAYNHKFLVTSTDAATENTAMIVQNSTTTGSAAQLALYGKTSGDMQNIFNNVGYNSTTFYNHGSSTAGSTGGISNANLAAIVFAGAAGGPAMGSVINNTNNVPMYLGVNSTTVITLRGSNVGIGTVNPRQMLEVGGVVRPTGYQSSDGTAGATVTTCTGFKNGLCISGT